MLRYNKGKLKKKGKESEHFTLLLLHLIQLKILLEYSCFTMLC